MREGSRDRWQRRPVQAAALRAVVFLIPINAAVATSALIARGLPAARGTVQLIGWWILTMAVSTLVLLVGNRIMRRFLPLAVLLTLTLAFPDEAPSRLRVARNAASTKTLRELVERARRDGLDDEPTRAAEQILALVAAVESHDRGTRGHSERVRLYTDLLAAEMTLSEYAKDRIRWAALLHDVGKLEVPGALLNKPGKLNEREWEQVKRHPDEGARLTGALRTWLGEWGRAIEEHHERYDGAGYPRGLQGDAISLAGRMVAVTDCYETMTAARAYRRPISGAKAREELVRCAGSHFDPTIVRAFLRVSIGRLGLVAGPLAWLAQTPFLRGLQLAAETAGRAAAGAAAAGGALALTLGPVVPPAQPDQATRPSVVRRQPSTETVALTTPAPDPSRSESPSGSPSPSPSPTRKPSPEPSESADPSPSPSRHPTTIPKPPSPPDREDAALASR